MEFALALPPESKVRDGVGKHVLKEAVAGLLPADLVHRKKRASARPSASGSVATWASAPRRPSGDSSLAERGLLDYDRVDELWAAHRSGRQEWSFQLWNLYNVSAWHDYWVAGRSLA